MSLTQYRGVEGEGDAFAEWVRNLRGKSGVYVLKERGWLGTSGRVVYVGESHSQRLYETLTRHFQSRKNSDPQSLSTYARDEVLVAVQICPAAKAVMVQDGIIKALRPRDNRNIPEEEAKPDTSFDFGANKNEEF